MGNAMVSDVFGDVVGYYNPALSSFQEEGIVNIGYTFMSMDRSLNFVSFTRKFPLPNQQNKGAGISSAPGEMPADVRTLPLNPPSPVPPYQQSHAALVRFSLCCPAELRSSIRILFPARLQTPAATLPPHIRSQPK